MDTENISKGYITKSGNFKLTKRIDGLDEFWNALILNKSIFARHRMYPTAFFYSWQIKEVRSWLNNGWFWLAEKIKENK